MLIITGRWGTSLLYVRGDSDSNECGDWAEIFVVGHLFMIFMGARVRTSHQIKCNSD